MSATVVIDAPAGAWTQINPGLSPGLQISNRSFSVPMRVAVKPTSPLTTDGFFVLAPGAAGEVPTQIYVESGESVWVRPHDHSGLAAKVAYQLDAAA